MSNLKQWKWIIFIALTISLWQAFEFGGGLIASLFKKLPGKIYFSDGSIIHLGYIAAIVATAGAFTWFLTRTRKK